jgi:hypothetical protein
MHVIKSPDKPWLIFRGHCEEAHGSTPTRSRKRCFDVLAKEKPTPHPPRPRNGTHEHGVGREHARPLKATKEKRKSQWSGEMKVVDPLCFPY